MSKYNSTSMETAIRDCSRITTDAAGREIRIIGEEDIIGIARRYACKPGTVCSLALDQEIWPHRYIRNRDSMGLEDQLKLLRSQVTIIGAGGLGGYVLQLLARIGIGTLVTVDPETFEASNLNRQAMAGIDTLGKSKADVAAEMLGKINPSVEVLSIKSAIDQENIDNILYGSNVAVDALDNAEARRILQEGCTRSEIPLVHGALTGFEGRVMTIFPGDPDLKEVYGDPGENTSDAPPAEAVMGTPAIAPAFIASLQAMEVIKILLQRGRPFSGRMLYADLENALFEDLRFS